MIASRDIGVNPFETLSRVARFYLSEGYNKKETRDLLDRFLKQCDPSASLTKWSSTLDNAVKRALTTNAVNIESIEVSQPEMDIIGSIDGKQTKRLAFTLLCLAKYWDIVSPNSNHWVNSKDSEIMRMANINTSIKRQSFMYHALMEKNLIQFSKKIDNTNVRVLFLADGSPALSITDYRNLGYQYLRYTGEPYFECQNCGVVTRLRDPVHGKKQKYCKDCAVSVAIQQRVNAIMRHNNTQGS